jgi:iron complex outermembrane recepter protein
MFTKTRVSRTLSVVALATAALISGASAQAASSSHSTIEEVVVTAERRSENLQTSALSATVLNEEMLAKKGVVGLTSLQYAAPGVQIADYASANTFNVRGIGQARVDIDLPSGVVIYRDGVPTLTGYFQNAPYYDMASLEVLRGPQGTFAGKAAAAGAVFIKTRDPDLEQFEGSVMVGAGNEGAWETTVVLNVPVSDHLALRLSGHLEERDSLFDRIDTNPLPGGTGVAAGPYNGSDDRDLESIRLGVRWMPTDSFDAVFKIDHDNLYFGNHGTTGLDPQTGKELDIRHLIANGEHKYRDKGERASLKMSWTLDNGIQIDSLTGYSTVDTRANRDINGPNPAPFGFRAGGTFTNKSQEIDILSPVDSRVRWVVGAFWQDYDSDIPDFTENGIGFDLDNGNRFDYTTPWKKEEESTAIFAQLEFDLSERLELQIGARWNEYEFDQFTNWAIDFVSFITATDPTGTGMGIETELTFLENGGAGFTEKFDENSFDWKVNLNYTRDDSNFFYFLISRGHTPGSINLANPDFFATATHNAYDEMSVINYEAGWKAAFYERQLRTQFNVYYQVFEDYQADFALGGPAALPSATLFQFQNAESDSVVWGMEFGAQAYIDDWEFDMGLAYFQSELGSFGLVQDPFAVVTGGPATIDLDGAETPFAPEWTANFGVGYTFRTAIEIGGNPIEITPRMDVAYRDDSYSRLFQNRATLMEGYTLVNAQVHFDSGPLRLLLWVNNLTDKDYVAAKQNVDASAGSSFVAGPHYTGLVYAGLPRLWGARLTYSF